MNTVARILFCLMVALGGLSMGSCTTWKTVVLPSGQEGFTVDCSGTNLTWSHCYQKAGRACPQGYDITQRMDAHGGKVAPGNLFGVLGGSVQDRSLLIQCRHDGVRPADDHTAIIGRAPISSGATTFPASSD